MENWITEIMNSFGYMGVFLLIMLENIFPPIPSEVILTFGGFMTTTTNMSVTGVVIASTAGSVAGAVILYAIGSILNVNRLEKVVDKWGYLLRLTKKDIHKAQSWFDKYGVWTIFFCRFIPLIRSLISIPAGMARMNFWLFFLLTTIGTMIWNVVLIKVGATVGSSWHDIVHFMDVYSSIAYIILALIFIIFLGFYIKSKMKKNRG